ncbi:MAG: hypothetical protein KDJ16_17765 [Hyphomicrobiales bacterium]|nr:hypothetical protein [Hyphomicrobiales bacterium]
MRLFLAALATVIALSVTPATAGNCPADAVKASKEIWPKGRVSTGTTVVGTHPCGRRIQCTGGDPGKKRKCKWL